MFDLNKITDKDKQILTEILNYQNMFKLKVIDIKQLNDIRILFVTISEMIQFMQKQLNQWVEKIMSFI
jgi:hypothetical protein